MGWCRAAIESAYTFEGDLDPEVGSIVTDAVMAVIDHRGVWDIVDSRTGRPTGMASYMTREQAEREIDYLRARDARGGRPDFHEYVPFLEARKRDLP